MHFSPTPMHLPDGFLSVIVAIACWLLSAGGVVVALRKTGHQLGERQTPLMGVLAAAIFAGQMLNFPVAGGTSGHLLGAALAAIVLGPWPAVLVMTTVVGVQALIFQDGGILALGANLLNMAIIGPFTGYAVYQLINKLAAGRKWGLFVGGFVSAWASIFIASLACALQLALSGSSPANYAVPAMGGIHAVIGIGEGLITVGALAFLYSARRDLLPTINSGAAAPAGNTGVLVVGALITVGLAVLSPLASAHPDGLEWVAEQGSFIGLARDSAYNLIPDYVMPGIPGEALATVLAGILGALIVFGIAFLFSRSRRRSQA